MVEYALTLAASSMVTLGSATRFFRSWVSGIGPDYIGYLLIGLLAFGVAFWAFRSPH